MQRVQPTTDTGRRVRAARRHAVMQTGPRPPSYREWRRRRSQEQNSRSFAKQREQQQQHRAGRPQHQQYQLVTPQRRVQFR